MPLLLNGSALVPGKWDSNFCDTPSSIYWYIVFGSSNDLFIHKFTFLGYLLEGLTNYLKLLLIQ